MRYQKTFNQKLREQRIWRGRKKIIGKVLTVIFIAFGMFVAMAWAGGTYPY